MSPTRPSLLRRLFTTIYAPDLTVQSHLERAQTQEDGSARVTIAVLDHKESERRFGVPLASHGVQPVFVRIENRADCALRLHAVAMDPSYYTALEAAAISHFSFARRLSAFGVLAWLVAPLLWLAPSKLFTAWRANRRIDECLSASAFRFRPIAPGASAEGFVFTTVDFGTKELHVRLLQGGGTVDAASQSSTEFVFTVPVSGIAADHARRDLEALHPRASQIDCDVPALVKQLAAMPAATSNRADTRQGDPVNLVVIGEFGVVLSAFAGRWDETETITLATCWKTARAFLLGTQYRYSPVSPLYLFGRSQDLALQRIRSSIDERLHLRLWSTPLRFRDAPVWIGQVSRDIGVRFTTKTWNLSTHAIDPDVDESRDYVVEDLLAAQRAEAVA